MSTTYSYNQQAQEDAEPISIYSPSTSTVEKGDHVRVQIKGNPKDNDRNRNTNTSMNTSMNMKMITSIDQQETNLFDNALHLRKGPFKHMEQKMPRTYNVCTYIIIPLLLLIGLSFLFGFGLATLEGPTEMEVNNQLLSDFTSKSTNVKNLIVSFDEKYKSCLVEYTTYTGTFGTGTGTGTGTNTNTNTNLLSFMEDCTNDKRIEITNDIDTSNQDTFMDLASNGLTYNWVKCGINETTGTSHTYEQSFIIERNWNNSFTSYKNIYLGQGFTENEAVEKAYTQADGSETCVMNYTGGAIFWFTIMTTIGYGNTVPVTMGGKVLVLVMGFVCILLFSVVIGNAGSIMLTIVDDYFHKVGLEQLTKGILSVLFWMLMLLLWLFGMSGIKYTVKRAKFGQFDKEYSYMDAFWFAYISVTTVGFGDDFIHHDTAKPIEMFCLPLLFLIGFVLVANFLLKFCDMVVSSVSSSSKELDVNMKSLRIVKEVVNVNTNGNVNTHANISTSMIITGMGNKEETNDFLNHVIVDECGTPSFEEPYQNDQNESQIPLNTLESSQNRQILK